MAFDESSMKQMDEAGEQAKTELVQSFEKWTAKDLASWWAKWYMKAGHKRLGRIVVGIGKVSGKPAADSSVKEGDILRKIIKDQS